MRSLKEVPIRADTGVIIGRFQVAELQKGQKQLIDDVFSRCDNVLIILGLSEAGPTKRNPLDYQSRKKMIRETYPEKDFPNLEIAYIKDTRDNLSWSLVLDKIIDTHVPLSHTVLLFGSRDSFISQYMGKYETLELEPDVFVSGTEQRTKISKEIPTSMDFRKGVIYTTGNRFPTSYQTVDIIPVQRVGENATKILLGKKSNEPLHRFIGGFVDPKDESLEAAAKRELTEEAGLFETGNMQYLGSYRINDWRYRSEEDKILTAVFSVDYVFGRPNPGDDIQEVAWFEFDQVSKNLMPEHLSIWEKVSFRINPKTGV